MKNLDFLINNIIAHRGVHDENTPENSIISFKKAINKGYTIELDVHLTKDNKIVVFHDNNLKRLCGVNKIIEDLTYKEILNFCLKDSKLKIPLLEEVLLLISGKVGVLIELKTIKFNGVLEEKLSKILDSYKGKFAVQSFNYKTVNWFKKNRPLYIRGLLATGYSNKKVSVLKRFLGLTLIEDIMLKTDFIAYDIKSLPNLYVKNKRKNKKILAWTIRNKKDYDKALKNADGYICENIKELF